MVMMVPITMPLTTMTVGAHLRKKAMVMIRMARKAMMATGLSDSSMAYESSTAVLYEPVKP